MGEYLEERATAKLMPRPPRRFIAVDLQRCTGCRACELICSWHLAKVFQPEQSYIRVYRDDRRGEVQVVFDSACDMCGQCVEFCAPEALKLMTVIEGSGYYVPPTYP